MGDCHLAMRGISVCLALSWFFVAALVALNRPVDMRVDKETMVVKGGVNRRLLDDSSRSPELVGGIGVGLFSLLFIGAFSCVGCVAAEATENPGVLRAGITFLYFSLVVILIALPKKRRDSPDDATGEFHSTWLWVYVITCVLMFVGLVLALAGLVASFLSVPIYALEDDRMARKR